MSPQGSISKSTLNDGLHEEVDRFLKEPDVARAANIYLMMQQVLEPSQHQPPFELYQSVFEQSPLAISITDKSANILYCNDSFSTVTGYRKSDVIGENESILSYKSTPKHIYQQMWETLSSKESWRGTLVNKRKNGERYLAEIVITPVLSASGEVEHYLGIHRDKTEIHKLQQRVMNQKIMIESVIDAAPDVIMVLDEKLDVVLDNHAYKKLVGDMQGKEPATILLERLHASDSDFALKLEAKTTFNNIVIECPINDHTKPRWFSCSGVWFKEKSTSADDYFEGHEVPYLMMMMHEVTTILAQKEAVRNNAMRALMAEDALITGLRESLDAATYKLQEPFNQLNAAVAMLSRRQLSDSEQHLLMLMQQISQRGQESLELLEQSIPKLEQTESILLSVNEVIHDVLRLNTNRLLREGIVVNWLPEKHLPNVQGQGMRLHGLFGALIDNAIESIVEASPPHREITIYTSHENRWMEIMICDNGIGISDADRFRVFEPFYSTKRNLKGKHTGMGLTVAQEVVNQMAGTLEVITEHNDGCCMCIRFPISR